MLEKEREIINRIDDEMKQLFLKRMEIVRTIAEFKKENDYAIYDPKREDEMVKRLTGDLSGQEKTFYREFLNHVLRISKEFQLEIVEGK